MSSLSRMLSILDLFSIKHPIWTAEEILKETGFSHGTGYRYIKTLADNGLISRSQKGYSLGPRMVEFDFLIRECDPLLVASRPILRELCTEVDGTVLLTNFFKDRVIVSHQETGTDQIIVSYGRGRRMPLFRGAASKAIIAALPRASQKKLFSKYQKDIAAAELGNNWDEFRDRLTQLSKQRVVMSYSELDQGNYGFAMPLKTDDAMHPAAVVLVFSERRFKILNKTILERTLSLAVDRISDAMAWRALDDVAGNNSLP